MLTLTLAFFGFLIFAGLMYLPYPPDEYGLSQTEAERTRREGAVPGSGRVIGRVRAW